MRTLKIRLKRSLISCTQTQRDTARCLGLRRLNQVSEFKDSPAVRGQIMKIQHLLDVKVGAAK